MVNIEKFLAKLEKFQVWAFNWHFFDGDDVSDFRTHSYLPLCFQLAENKVYLLQLWKG